MRDELVTGVQSLGRVGKLALVQPVVQLKTLL